MKIIQASSEIITATPDLEQVIELAGRVCWKSEDKICDGSAEKLIKFLKGKNHASVMEHGVITVKIVCDRGVSHELVRHRIASFSQESTRYVNYSKDKQGGGITVIQPCFWGEGTAMFHEWKRACQQAEETYLAMLDNGAGPQEARSVLPNSLKTEIFVTANVREWQHIFELRCAPAAHPSMREIMIPLQEKFAKYWPSIFGDHLDA
jgi:thymidylate synthase (FAD)